MSRSQQTKVAPRVGLYSKALFWGAHLTPGPTVSYPPNGGISFENWTEASKKKLLLAVGLQRNFFFEGSPNPWAHRVHPLQRGYLLFHLPQS